MQGSSRLTSDASAYLQPPWSTREGGGPRRVGVELEMNGLTLEELADTAARVLGCTIREKGRYERVLEGDPDGDWQVELDFRLLARLGRKDHPADTVGGELMQSAESALAWLAENLVPLELVSPPLPFARLPAMDELVAALRSAGARGTSDSLTNAFGMQLNPELPAGGPALIRSVLQAFICMQDWLSRRADIDPARRITRYVEPFPTTYLRKVVDPGYDPGLATLIDDYLAANPTRNRALDLLPLFAHLDETRVRQVTDDPLIKPRPAFHYRLPDCEIHRQDWSISEAWNDWVLVERLANDQERLAGCREACARFMDRPWRRWFGDWAAEFEKQWLPPR